MTDSGDTDTPVFPIPRRCPFAPLAQHAKLRAEGSAVQVVVRDGAKAWLVLRHDLARTVLARSEVTSDRSHPSFPPFAPGLPAASRAQGTGFLSWMDPPEHTLYRRMDLVTALALPVPSLAICELLGVPYADRELFQTRTQLAITDVAEQGRALGELRAFLGAIVTDRQEHPRDDLLSRLIAKYREAGVFDHAHVVGQALFLLMAGHETTANMISLGALALLERPERAAGLRADPALVPGAVEELLRYFSIADATTSRVALADIEAADVVISAGEGVIVSNAGANRDPLAFEDPETLDLRRDARGHLAFGFGAHQCLGQNLARLELEVVFTRLLARIPALRLAVDADEVPLKYAAHIYGIHTLPVAW